MVDLDWKSKLVSSDNSPKLSLSEKPMPLVSLPTLKPPFSSNDISLASSHVCAAYDNYLRLPQLRTLWASNNFPNWAYEPILKPILHALEITFHFLATVLSDPRPYVNQREWTRRVESLAKSQLQLIATLIEDEEQDPETRGNAPVTDINGISEIRSYSEKSLLPKLATWHKSKDAAQRILSTVESELSRCPYTLGLGEPNLAGKQILRYDAVCNPNEIHSLETTPYDYNNNNNKNKNYENRTVHATHQILESLSRAARGLMKRAMDSIERRRFEKAASEFHAVEGIWKLLIEVEDLHMMMDPEDFLRLKKEIGVRSWNESETVPFCFRSKEVVELTKECREMKQKVPEILEVEVDPKGGPRVMEAAMKVYAEKRFEKVHVLQSMEGVESGMKRFFYAYKQVVKVVMGSSEAKFSDSLSQIFLEPTYFPSLDAAKTFLGYYWENAQNPFLDINSMF